MSIYQNISRESITSNHMSMAERSLEARPALNIGYSPSKGAVFTCISIKDQRRVYRAQVSELIDRDIDFCTNGQNEYMLLTAYRSKHAYLTDIANVI